MGDFTICGKFTAFVKGWFSFLPKFFLLVFGEDYEISFWGLFFLISVHEKKMKGKEKWWKNKKICGFCFFQFGAHAKRFVDSNYITRVRQLFKHYINPNSIEGY